MAGLPRTLVRLSAVALALAWAGVAWGASPLNKNGDGLVLDGIDVVSYFTDGKPAAGSAEFSTEWNGGTWHFASAEHRDLFVANPEKYAPQFGGFCALAVSRGGVANVDPEAFVIVDNRLYLFVSDATLAFFKMKDVDNIAKADEVWPTLMEPMPEDVPGGVAAGGE